MGEVTIEAHLQAIDRDGYTIIEGAMEPDLVAKLRDEVRCAEREALGGGSAKELAGTLAQLRTNGLLANESFQQVPVHPAVLPIVEGVIGRDCLLSADAALEILPGMRRLPYHSDDALYGVPRPHPPLMCTAMWALTDFTPENGATVFTPGSHRFPEAPDYTKDPSEFETVSAEMSAGSVIVFEGQLWHTSGDNTADDQGRLGLQLSYCRGWLRPQTNYYLSIPPEKARRLPARLQELVGYGTCNGLGRTWANGTRWDIDSYMTATVEY